MTAPRKPANGGIFAQKALISIVSFLCVSMIGWCIWLSLEVIEIGKTMAIMETNVDTLLKTKESQAAINAAHTTRRVDKLENDAE